jgi:uncharacterized membrane protein affecting hemolysin expression
MKTVLLALLFAVLIVVVLFGGLYVYARGHGFSAREQPSWMERTMPTQKVWRIRASNKRPK